MILFQRNVSIAAHLRKLIDSLQEIAKAAGHKQPLFIAIDQENGRATRIKPPIAAQLPGSMALGATGDPQNVTNIAGASAEMLKSFGINMTYACVADVNSEPKNPVIGVRSFSDDPETVGTFVTAQFKAYQEKGVVPCVKHFPGHGDTAVDSHFGLPDIGKSRAELDSCELLPFRMAVKEGVDAVMKAHIALPGLEDTAENVDKHLPASLNPHAISILRKEMGFHGLILSDCLEMDGVRATYGVASAAVMALKVYSSRLNCVEETERCKAGTDCVIICHTLSAQISAIEAVKKAIRSGELSQEVIEKSIKRVQVLKTKYLSAPNPSPSDSFWTELYSRQYALAADTYSRSTTVVRSSPGVVPLRPSPDSSVIFLYASEVDLRGEMVAVGEHAKESNTKDQATYLQTLRSSYPAIDPMSFSSRASLSPEEESRIEKADTVILATQNANLSPYRKEMGLRLGKKLGDKLVVIATCDPYDFLEDEVEVKNYIAIYEPSVEAFEAASKTLFGKIKATGKLPVKIRKTR